MNVKEYVEVINKMVASDDVKQRDRGVIAKWLAENTEIPDVLNAADELIKAQGEHDLWTFLASDVKGWYVIGSKSQP